VPQGCNTSLFLKIKKQPLPKDIREIPSPIIGFSGNINYRLNFFLIKSLALSQPEWAFVFIGPFHYNPKQDKIINFNKNLKELQKIKNIYFLGRKSKKQLVAYIDNLDIGIIPYNIKQKYNLYCYPMKVFEYFARGKPVVSTPIESLIPLQPYVKIAKDAKEFSLKIAKILKTGWSKKYQKEQRKLAIANSWKKKIERISQILKEEFRII
ncbi:unnamed protein product, partial [marine sediment metagenome]